MFEWYAIAKFLHVLAVIVWLGGGFSLVILAVRADRANDTDDFVRILRHVVFMSGRIFIPTALAALVFGLITAILWDYAYLWLYIGLLGFAATFGTGALVLGPRSTKVMALVDKEGVTPEALRQGREILSIAKADFVVLFTVVADMVLKPGWSNWITLIVMVLVVAGGVYYFVGDIIGPFVQARMGKPAA